MFQPSRPVAAPVLRVAAPTSLRDLAGCLPAPFGSMRRPALGH